MHSGPYLLSTEANDLVRATRSLRQVTHESWTFDGYDRTLVCPHGVRVPYRLALGGPSDVLRTKVAARHDGVYLGSRQA